jgi:hypothetical protein
MFRPRLDSRLELVGAAAHRPPHRPTGLAAIPAAFVAGGTLPLQPRTIQALRDAPGVLVGRCAEAP